MFKKIVIGCLCSSCLFFSVNVMATNEQTISLGYSQAKIEGIKLNGVNLNYHYELSNNWGIVGSFTWMKGDKYYAEEQDNDGFTSSAKTDVNYVSLLAGPSYRINNFANLYGLAGISKTKLNNRDYGTDDGYIESSYYKYKSTGIAWGAGIQLNPINNLAINIGYEGTKFSNNELNSKIHGFNVGVGYRF